MGARRGTDSERLKTDGIVATAVAAASTQVEKTSGPIFLFGGAADDVWPSCQFVQMAVQRLKEAVKPSNMVDMR